LGFGQELDDENERSKEVADIARTRRYKHYGEKVTLRRSIDE